MERVEYRLGTRTSHLAWTQSGHVAAALGPDVVRVGVETEGDRLVDVPLQGALSKGFFTAALEEALLSGRVDLAVHSLKDLPVEVPAALPLGAIPPRAPVADLLIVHPSALAADFDPHARGGEGLPLRAGARVGATSNRRQSMIRALRPDLAPVMLRGNVPTRIQRLREGKFEAIVLAEAGVARLGGLTDPASPASLEGLVVLRLLPQDWPPAPGQGALAVQCRADDTAVLARLAAIHHAPTAAAVAQERAWLASFGGGCAVPFGAWVEGESWAIGLEREGRFAVRRGVGLAAGGEALAALLAGEPGDAWALQWERVETQQSETQQDHGGADVGA